MKQQPLDFSAAPVAPQAVTMAPSARESRRSGLRAARAKATPQMAEYRALLERRGPMTDQDAANALGWPLSTVNGRRNDWINMRRGSVVDRGRVVIIHPDGSRTSRTRWVFVADVADAAVRA